MRIIWQLPVLPSHPLKTSSSRRTRRHLAEPPMYLQYLRPMIWFLNYSILDNPRTFRI
ncbi:hypothetical protein SS1G_08546 [Sclerotinia sclerotiorum 1980 UF-70]|uniref:Uncharacterized protein n=1 Tax=Sclerotinia sclerotiorum (strain ATCC 18683 / 1980 / Ss-1) TaxID=665079 RepID=A7ET91_SCLS1|nr:hypothetical protein SS1G_08546 [Sclerotinia sclerotiorum 1980 UF-70]EDN92683.1 hypothetical protein SS1G_08546 [Sclerotinia sclerotiorum 1980 UF-70]